ncbi:phage holin family protein [Roseomonas sp. SSH11]|uniref:Phage holin family protein n=1 Tax=Pararoseomonas baculiformis TaxID=2820812 RepID=A0ABS4AIW5_9PROT|nr:phage holin family protein [Pararoseomonas baculiformis]MBP0446967.1 phage holin family protein [Pararoseomonas baculiformis]
MSHQNDRSIPDLLGDLVDQTSTLVRKEVQLARAELGEKASLAGAAAASIAVGAFLLLAALIVLLQAAVAALIEYVGLSATVSALIVAVLVAVIGYIVLRGGLNRLKASNLTPDRTVTQLSRDAGVVKEQVR